MIKLDLVFNPAAGAFREARLERLVSAFADNGIAATPLQTTPECARLSGSAELVCVHGGDGALRATVKAMGEDVATVPVCIAPSGTINLVARELGYERDPVKLAAQVAQAWLRGPESWLRSPMFKLDDTPIVSCLSIGPDSAAVAAASGELKRRIGRFAYVAAMMKQLARWPREEMQISGELADGTEFSTKAEAVIASHGALYAGPFRLSPKAGLASNSVELITLDRATRWSTLVFSSAAMIRYPVGKLGTVEIRSIRRAKLEGFSLPVQVDGDHVENCQGIIEPTGLAVQYCV